MPQTITILVLGRSDTHGQGLDDVQKSWPYVVRSRVEDELGHPTHVEVRRLTPDGRDPSAYLQRLFDEIHPDEVCIAVTAYDFGVARVENRVRDLFGRRVAGLAAKMELKTRAGQTDAEPSRLNRWSRRVVRRFVGVAPIRARADVERTLDLLFRFLGQQENLAVVVRGSGAGSPVLNKRNPGYAALVAEFNAEWKKRALQRHFYWVDTSAGLASQDYQIDAVHVTESGAAARTANIAPVMIQAIRETVLDVDRRALPSTGR